MYAPDFPAGDFPNGFTRGGDHLIVGVRPGGASGVASALPATAGVPYDPFALARQQFDK